MAGSRILPPSFQEYLSNVGSVWWDIHMVSNRKGRGEYLPGGEAEPLMSVAASQGYCHFVSLSIVREGRVKDRERGHDYGDVAY
ncbi:hypothetical protein CRG98_002401 [Punica granatum]|uniref:Uncharacterized protein n=1 Tax=Punica granatum TaxID=22663 RepID=A0A2I0L931_PUNGR|nr:hypothetical protein CRG98_002401 [Punica granatum]